MTKRSSVRRFTGANFLILDEPTNHLDITSKEILENALSGYTGTVLYVSHDRYFINKTATRILELSSDGITSYLGNYDDYVYEKEKLAANSTTVNEPKKQEESDNKRDWKLAKEEQAKERKRQNDIKKIEAKIEELETNIEEINDEMNKPDNATNSAKLNELATRHEELSNELEKLYEEWEKLSEE